MTTKNYRKVWSTLRRTSTFIFLVLIAFGSGGCGGWYIKFSTPPPAPCPIEDLLLDESDFPSDDWQEVGSSSYRAAPVRMGIEKIGTSFSNPVGGIIQAIYRLESDKRARSAYSDVVESWFHSTQAETEYWIPEEFNDLSVNADQYRIGCVDLLSGGWEQCTYAAQYGPYVLRVHGQVRSLSYDEFIDLVLIVDQKAINCLNP